MKIETTLNDYIISLPKNAFGSNFIDRLLADLRIIEISSKTEGSESDVKRIADEIDSNWWKKNRSNYIK